jgi:hypothetical protein
LGRLLEIFPMVEENCGELEVGKFRLQGAVSGVGLGLVIVGAQALFRGS